MILFSDTLVIIDEFLFGPSYTPGPTETERWKLRAAVILNKTGGIVSLSELLPYVDEPPKSIHITHSSLSIVSHFRGKPLLNRNAQEDGGSANELFCFRELSESVSEIDSILNDCVMPTHDFTSRSVLPQLYRSTSTPNIQSKTSALPLFLVQQTYNFTNLTQSQFYSCVFVAIMNYFGIIWGKSLLEEEMILNKFSFPLFITSLHVIFLCLHVYSVFFLFMPVLRFLVYSLLNARINNKNHRRSSIANELIS